MTPDTRQNHEGPRTERTKSRRRRVTLVGVLCAIAILGLLLAAGAFYLFHSGPEGGTVSVTIPPAQA